MGGRGYNAGGFAYMAVITCPKCGCRRKLGHDAIKRGWLECGNKSKCDARAAKGHLLHRLGKTKQ